MYLHNYVISNLWLESNDYDTNKVLENILFYHQNNQRIENFCYILHNKDLLENGDKQKPHYYIVLCLKKQTLSSTLAKLLEIPECYLEQTQGTLAQAIQYSIHLNSTDERKYHYKEEDITTSDTEWLSKKLDNTSKITDDEKMQIFFELCDWISEQEYNLNWIEIIKYVQFMGVDYVNVFMEKSNNINLHYVFEDHNRLYKFKKRKLENEENLQKV